MNNLSGVEDHLFSTIHPYISKKTSVFAIVVSLMLAFLAIAMIVVSVSVDYFSTVMNMSLLTLGTILLLLALYRIFWKSVEVIYLPTGSVVLEGTFYIDSCDLPVMKQMMESKNFSLLTEMNFKSSGNGRVDYLTSKDGQFVAVQLFRFVPYTYEPASQVYYYMGDDATAFMHCLSAK